jgi:hypothetical protein
MMTNSLSTKDELFSVSSMGVYGITNLWENAFRNMPASGEQIRIPGTSEHARKITQGQVDALSELIDMPSCEVIAYYYRISMPSNRVHALLELGKPNGWFVARMRLAQLREKKCQNQESS